MCIAVDLEIVVNQSNRRDTFYLKLTTPTMSSTLYTDNVAMIGFILAGVYVYINTRHRYDLEIQWSLRQFTSITHQLGVSLIN